MAKILNVNDMLDAGWELAENGVADPKRFAILRQGLEAAADALAEFLAEATAVTYKGGASYEGDAGGLCASFYIGPNGEECDVIGTGDEGGEWSRHATDPNRATWEQAEAAGYAVQDAHDGAPSYPASVTFTLPGGKPDTSKRKFVCAAYAREGAADHLEETR